MSEDIKILEKMFYDNESFEPNNYVEIFFHKEEQEAIKNLIKRNKEIEKENEYYKKIIIEKEINENFQILYEKTLKAVHTDCILKSKVKEKIKELEKEVKDYQCEKNRINFYQRKVLQELLDGDD